MLDFKEPNIKIADISQDKKYVRFVVEPLERGYEMCIRDSSRCSCFQDEDFYRRNPCDGRLH